MLLDVPRIIAMMACTVRTCDSSRHWLWPGLLVKSSTRTIEELSVSFDMLLHGVSSQLAACSVGRVANRCRVLSMCPLPSAPFVGLMHRNLDHAPACSGWHAS